MKQAGIAAAICMAAAMSASAPLRAGDVPPVGNETLCDALGDDARYTARQYIAGRQTWRSHWLKYLALLDKIKAGGGGPDASKSTADVWGGLEGASALTEADVQRLAALESLRKAYRCADH